MNTVIANQDELYVAPGGPTYRLTQRLAMARFGRISGLQRIVCLLLVTWAPMCVFALLQGYALGGTPRESFLLDFATYARFFIAIPVLIVAEKTIASRLAMAGMRFVHDGFVCEQDYPGFSRAIARLAGRRESVLATAVIIGFAIFGAWNLTFESASGVDSANWQSVMPSVDHAVRYNLASLWGYCVALPILLFLWYRWLWRILIWTLFLYDVSRLNLVLVPTHADRAGGLGFLQEAHASFGIFAFVVGSVLSAGAAFRIVFEDARMELFQMPLVIVLLVMQLLFLGPLLVFMPTMARVRRAALLSYGSLVDRYNRSFHHKWIASPTFPSEPLLGSADIQSLADMGNSFHFVSDMRITPFDRRAVIQMAVATLLPGLPLIFLLVPVSQILDALAKVAL